MGRGQSFSLQQQQFSYIYTEVYCGIVQRKVGLMRRDDVGTGVTLTKAQVRNPLLLFYKSSRS